MWLGWACGLVGPVALLGSLFDLACGLVGRVAWFDLQLGSAFCLVLACGVALRLHTTSYSQHT